LAILGHFASQANVMCGHLMMRSFSLNENCARQPVRKLRVNGKLTLLPRSQDENGDTLIYWQNAR